MTSPARQPVAHRARRHVARSLYYSSGSAALEVSVTRFKTLSATWCAAAIVASALTGAAYAQQPSGGAVAHLSRGVQHAHIDCAAGRAICTEVYDSEAVFGEDHYVGHDEPSLLF